MIFRIHKFSPVMIDGGYSAYKHCREACCTWHGQDRACYDARELAWIVGIILSPFCKEPIVIPGERDSI